MNAITSSVSGMLKVPLFLAKFLLLLVGFALLVSWNPVNDAVIANWKRRVEAGPLAGLVAATLSLPHERSPT